METGGAYSWGSNKHGQLGLGVTGSKELLVAFEEAPKRLAEIKGMSMVSAAAGPNHSVLVGSDGSMWTFGCNKNGELGHSLYDDCCGVPRRVDSFGDRCVQTASAAPVYTAFSTKFQSASTCAAVFVMGMGKWTPVRVSLPFTTSQWTQILAESPVISVYAQAERTW